MTNFNRKSSTGSGATCRHQKHYLYSNLKIVNLVAVKTGYSAFLTPGSQTLSFDLGGYFLSIKLSGMGKNQDPGSVINIPDPQNWDIYVII
jgi:hypothetical protein